jgi:hypothetical protein
MDKEGIKDEQIRQDTNEWANQQERILMEFFGTLKATRDEPGISIREISDVIKRVFEEDEILSLIRELKADK